MALNGNPFAQPSSLPFGLPDFARIRAEHFEPAITEGMSEHLRELHLIGTDPQPATFANTIEAMERTGALLKRACATFFNLIAAQATPELEEIQATIAPALAAHDDAIYLDAALFARVDALMRASAQGENALDEDQQRLLERYHRRFVRAGAAASAAEQDELRAINTELAALTTAFERKLLADTVEQAVFTENLDDLQGLDDAAIAAAAQAAAGRGENGYLLTLTLPTNQAPLEHLVGRDVRQRLFEASTHRAIRGNENDTRGELVRIVQLRARRARLLGYDTFADYVVAEGTAKTLAAVDDMLSLVVAPAMANAHDEAAQLEAALVADGQAPPLQPWDWAYYARQVRDATFAVDTAALRPYFELNRVLREGVFYCAQELYGLTFVPRDDLVAYADDVQIYEVRRPDGSAMGLFMADWYTRDSKRGGAWMNSFVEQSQLLDEAPVIVINLNIARPAPGDPTLLTLDEVLTAFHEFGHVLHGLLSNVRYPSQSGTDVPNDFVEFPSQVNEMWAFWPQVLTRYARHHETDEPLPAAWVTAVQDAAKVGQGFATTEYLAAALLDLAWHRLDETQAAALSADDVLTFEAKALQDAGIGHPLIPPRYRSSYFAHIFDGQYGANYFAYIWSEVLDADTVDWFTENGGLVRTNGEIFERELLSRGDSRDPMEAFAAVRGRPPRIEPLLRRRGLDRA